MTYKYTIQCYRYGYAQLLRLYPKPFRERFGEGMEQTFSDLLRERVEEEKGLLGCVIWMFVETFEGIIKENLMSDTMPTRKIVRVLLVAACLLIVPLTASFFVEGWNWGVGGYVFAWIMFSSVGLGYTFVASRVNGIAYKVAVGLAAAAAFVLVWMTAAVEIIGDDNPANALYLGVLLVGMIGAGMARFQPQGMARTLLAMAVAQMAVPLIALIFWRSNFAPGVGAVFTLNAVFALLWIGSALLFRRASATGANWN